MTNDKLLNTNQPRSRGKDSAVLLINIAVFYAKASNPTARRVLTIRDTGVGTDDSVKSQRLAKR